MPKIEAATVAEHREQRRDALLDVAGELLRDHGAAGVTMGVIAERAGMSRSAVYEYYRSAADLIADVIVDEIAAWTDHLDDCCSGISDPRERLITWIRSALAYVADGRHALVRAAGDATLPPVRRAQVQSMHRDLARPIVEALRELDIADPDRAATFVWAVVDATTRRIDHLRAPQDEGAHEEVEAAVTFILAGLDLS